MIVQISIYYPCTMSPHMGRPEPPKLFVPLPSRKYVSISPLPFTGINPRQFNWKPLGLRSCSTSWVTYNTGDNKEAAVHCQEVFQEKVMFKNFCLKKEDITLHCTVERFYKKISLSCLKVFLVQKTLEVKVKSFCCGPVFSRWPRWSPSCWPRWRRCPRCRTEASWPRWPRPQSDQRWSQSWSWSCWRNARWHSWAGPWSSGRTWPLPPRAGCQWWMSDQQVLIWRGER